MRICFLCVEIFGWGKYGGFGKATRKIGSELAKRGYEVYAIVPRRMDQKPLEHLDGIKVYGFPRCNPFDAIRLIHTINADIYHSEEPSFLTYLAKKFQPRKKHMITFRDTRAEDDWKVEMANPSKSKFQVFLNILFEDNFFVKRAVRSIDNLYAAAECVAERAQKKYRLKHLPVHLPTPVDMGVNIQKAAVPTVCFLARFDRRKMPEDFFKLAQKFPEVHFIAMGSNSRDKAYSDNLLSKYCNLPNLDILGFVDHFNSKMLSDVLSKSWILVNTSLREGLPNSFLEAAAYKCALLGSVDPDSFTTRFGYRVQHRNFEEGLKWLLTEDRWKEKGEAGYSYVKETYANDKAIDRHIEIYKELLG